MKRSLYLETTIPSYLAGRISNSIIIAGRQAITHEFWEDERSKYNLFVSDYVHEECEKGDPVVAKRRLEYIDGITVLAETPDIEPLADVYMRMLSIPLNKRIDAFHLAMCCVNRIDILLSWNCTHLGTDSMMLAKKHNDLHGLYTPRMVTPDFLVGKYMEVVFDE